jgi:hypothetical protein
MGSTHQDGGPLTPECDKLHAVRDETLLIEQFIEFLEGQNLEIVKVGGDGEWYPLSCSTTSLVHRYHGIDENALEAERQALLELQRSLNSHPRPV